MPQIKGMRWQTAVDVVAQGLESHIASRSAELVRSGEFLSLLRKLEPPARSARVIGITHITRLKGVSRSGRPEPGSIPDRVLEIVGEFDEPVAMSQILDANHGAKHHSVILAVRALVNAGQLEAIGATTKRRYSLPNIKKGKRA
jgi:hypothetical protein